MMTIRSESSRWLARAAVVAAIAVARVSSAQELDQKQFNLFADPAVVRCLAAFPDDMLDAVVESAEECPGECIFIEAE